MKKNISNLTTPDELNGFTRVHQGGHHAVYCNGNRHIWTRGGGFTGMSEPRIDRTGSCDCHKYRK